MLENSDSIGAGVGDGSNESESVNGVDTSTGAGDVDNKCAGTLIWRGATIRDSHKSDEKSSEHCDSERSVSGG